MTTAAIRALASGAAAIGLFAAVVSAVPTPETASAAGLDLAPTAFGTTMTCTLTATPTTTTVVADAEVRQSNATTNYGTQTTMTVTSSGTANRRAYVRFDLGACSPAIPSTAIVDVARLRLYVTALPSTCRTIDLFAVGTAWSETTLTWSNQPFGTALNNPASAARTDSFNAGTPTGCENRTTGTYIAGAEVTADVAAFVAGSATNFGWMLRDDVEGAGSAQTLTISAKQLGTLAQAPQLIVTYRLAP